MNVQKAKDTEARKTPSMGIMVNSVQYTKPNQISLEKSKIYSLPVLI